MYLQAPGLAGGQRLPLRSTLPRRFFTFLILEQTILNERMTLSDCTPVTPPQQGRGFNWKEEEEEEGGREQKQLL